MKLDRIEVNKDSSAKIPKAHKKAMALALDGEHLEKMKGEERQAYFYSIALASIHLLAKNDGEENINKFLNYVKSSYGKHDGIPYIQIRKECNCPLCKMDEAASESVN